MVVWHNLAHMNLELFERMEAAELRSYIEFFLRHYRVMDAFWFIYLTEKYGQAAAEKINEQVWGRVGGMAAKDIMARFGIQERGVPGFLRVLQYYPWTILIGYQIQESTGEAILSVPVCPVQEARLKRGLGEYACRAMHEAEFVSLAGAVDPGIRVECRFAPPGPHPSNMHCQWRFYCEAKV